MNRREFIQAGLAALAGLFARKPQEDQEDKDARIATLEDQVTFWQIRADALHESAEAYAQKVAQLPILARWSIGQGVPVVQSAIVYDDSPLEIEVEVSTTEEGETWQDLPNGQWRDGEQVNGDDVTIAYEVYPGCYRDKGDPRLWTWDPTTGEKQYLEPLPPGPNKIIWSVGDEFTDGHTIGTIAELLGDAGDKGEQ